MPFHVVNLSKLQCPPLTINLISKLMVRGDTKRKLGQGSITVVPNSYAGIIISPA